MNTEVLRKIGLSDNEIKIYITLLKTGSISAYEISKKTGIYRANVYDKVEQLMDKGLVTHVYKGAKKYFQASDPSQLKQYIENKKQDLLKKEKELDTLLPELEKLKTLPRVDTIVETFKGKEGLKYFLKDIIKTRQEVLVTGIDDQKYQETLPIFMKQYFRDLTKNQISERIITHKKSSVFLFDNTLASTTNYKFLEATQFNPTNTFIYGEKVVIVSWGTPITAIMIKNKEIAQTYKDHFEYLWNIASQD